MSTTYLEYSFKANPLQPATDILIAELNALGFESFAQTEEGVHAYINKESGKEIDLSSIKIFSDSNFKIDYQVSEIAPENWNAKWESNFEPIQIGYHCGVRAPFHEKPDVQYDIVIEPKMSFGTGHHDTTNLMLQFLLRNDLQAKSVLDMGCGTGVLAILTAMKGAATIDAIDIDPWSYKNARENVIRNNQGHINVFEGDAHVLKKKKYDIILANINRNILLKDIPRYAKHLKKGGFLILSGFYQEDISMISEKCAAYGLSFQENMEKNNWVAAKYVF